MIDRWTSHKEKVNAVSECGARLMVTNSLIRRVHIVHMNMFLDNSWLPQFWPPLLEKLGKLHELYDQELGLMKKLTLNSPEVRLIFDSVAHPWIIDEWQRITHDLKIKHCCSASHSRSFIVLSLFQRASFSTLAGKRKSHTGQTEKSGASKGVTWRTCVTCPMVLQTRSSMKRAPDANGNSRFDSWYLDADTTTCLAALPGLLREESEEPPLDCVLSHGGVVVMFRLFQWEQTDVEYIN